MKKLFYCLLATLLLAGLPMQAQTRGSISEELRSKVVTTIVDSDRGTSTPTFKDSFRNTPTPSRAEKRTGADGSVYYDLAVPTNDRGQYGNVSQYAVCWQWPMEQPIAKGDVLLVHLEMRTISARQESGESVVYVYFQENQPPHNKSFITQIGTGSEWKEFDIPFTANRNFAVGEGILEFALGALAQQVEIRGVKLYNFKQQVDVAELPETRFTYQGREAGAAWREQALRRIEELRTAPLAVEVTDANGRPVKGAEVEVELLQSDFIWGSSANEALTAGERDQSETYRQVFKEFFNTATIENGFKAGGWNGDRRSATLKAFEWLEANGFRQRGHNLVWPGWRFNSPVTKEIAERDPVVFDRYIRAQFYERMAITKGRVIAWDVINELMHEKDFYKILPEEVSVDWFKLAKQLDPDAQLFINEYSMLNCVQSPGNIAEYIDKIESMRAQGAPIEAIGVQGHVGRQPRNPEQVLTDLDLFVPTGLPVQITEFDINSPDEELQADYLRDFLIAVYSHPVVTGVILWGFWEASHWKPDAAMFRRDWSPKPSAAVWREWVTGAWKTHKTVATDKRGSAEVRGHFGTYRVKVTYKGTTVEQQCHLEKSGNCLHVSL